MQRKLSKSNLSSHEMKGFHEIQYCKDMDNRVNRRADQLPVHLDLDLDNNCQSSDGYFGNGWSVHDYGHDVADRWLLKDDTEANEVMESGNEFHSVIVLAAKDF